MCVDCLLGKTLTNYPPTAQPAQIEEYQRRVRTAIDERGERCGPEVSAQINRAYRELFGPGRDYSEIKRHFNELMLTFEPRLQAAVEAADDSLRLAIQYAMAGNLIDFSAFKSVEDEKLREVLDTAAGLAIDDKVLARLRRELSSARRLVFFTDNCGEIVTDKILIRAISRFAPGLHITVIVKGEPVVNDATMEDARQVGMAQAADAVMDSGSGMAGTVLSDLSPQARCVIDGADVLIAKGQANYESLGDCGKNLFYIFMCKCPLFTERFGVPLYSGILISER